jgi:hypothetical protein
MNLCRVFGKDEHNFMPIKFMYMMTQISSFCVNIVFDFVSYIVEEINIGLVGIEKSKKEKAFGHYSLLMHMFLFKGVTYFEKEMVLNEEHEGEALPVQLWSVDMTWDVEKTGLLRFDRYFASRLRCLILRDNPRIPKALMDFIKPMDNPSNLKVSHNWADIIPYPILTVFRVYSFQGTPHVLPYQVPLKVGIDEMLWQIGGLEEAQLVRRNKGSIFPTYIVVHHFIITKGGWLFLYKFLDQYKMPLSHPHFFDTEGFFDVFR